MAASDLLVEVGDPGSATTLDSNYTIADSSVTVVSTTNWPASPKAVIFAIDEAIVVSGVEQQVAGTYNEFEGTVASATSITNVDWKRGSGDRNYTAGALTRVYIPVAAERENRIVEWGTVEHNQDGTHTTGVVQMVYDMSSAVATGTTTIPLDDSTPQITEGKEFMTLAITPSSVTNLLVIEVVAHLSSSIAQNMVGAIFQDSTPSALYATGSRAAASVNTARQLVLKHVMVAGTTSSTTFKFRAGGNGAGTTTFNGEASNRRFGAIPKSSITITEIRV